MIRRLILCLILAAPGPLAAQNAPRTIAVGLRGGIEIHRGGDGDKHLGVQAWIPLRDRLQVVPALDLLYEFPDDPLSAWSGHAWRAYLTIRAQPFERVWLPTLGYGLAAYYAGAENRGRSLNVSSTDLTDTAVFAFAGPRWRVQPYAEVYLVNILRRAGETGSHFFLGFSVDVR